MAYIRKHIDKFLLAFFLIFSSYYIDWWPENWNTASRAALPLSMVLEGDLNIDEYASFTGDKALINGHYYSDKGPSIGFIMTPIVYVINLVYPLDSLPPFERLRLIIGLGAFLFGSIPFSLAALLIFKRHLRNYRFGVPLTILFFFGSFLFIFSGSFYSHTFAGLSVLLAVITLEKKKYFLSGLMIGIAFMTEYTLAVFGVGIGVYLLVYKLRDLPWFCAGALVMIALQGIYNYQLSGSAIDFAYKYQENFTQNASNYGFGPPSLSNLYDITLSPYRGMFFFTPVLIIGLFAADWKAILQSNSGRVYLTLIITCFSYILLFSMSKSWHSGWSYGPRYLMPVPIILFYVLSSQFRKDRVSQLLFLITGTVGIVMAFLDKATVLYPPTNIQTPFNDVIWPAFIKGNFNTWNLFSSMGYSGLSSFIIFCTAFLSLAFMLTLSSIIVRNNVK